MLTIYDSGGQKVFATLHHLLAAPGGTCYVVVFSLKEMCMSAEDEKRVTTRIINDLSSIQLHAKQAPVLLVGMRSAHTIHHASNTPARPPGLRLGLSSGTARHHAWQREAASTLALTALRIINCCVPPCRFRYAQGPGGQRDGADQSAE